MATTTSPRPSPTDMTGQVLTEAARRMLPVLAGKLVTALADQAVARVEGLADRLDASRERLGADPDPDGGDTADIEDADDDTGPSSAGGGVGAFLMAQARALLDLVVRLVARAAEMLRRATERLRARRAPEGIEAEAPEQLGAADEEEGLEDLEDSDRLEDDEDTEDAEEREDEPAMA